MKILHIDSSILGDGSVSRRLSGEIVGRLRAASPDAEVIYRDLGAAPVAHLSGAYLVAAQSHAQGGSADHAPGVVEDLAVGGAVMAEFLAADTVVIGVAFYNFGISSQLKAWIDRIVVAGQTFRYGEGGRPEGLAGGKRVILAIARGGLYGAGSPFAAFEHAETYLRGTLGFIGITDLEVIIAEGLAVGPEQREASISAAERQIAALAA